MVVVGRDGPLKERFCKRLAMRTRGTVLSVMALVRAAEHAIELERVIQEDDDAPGVTRATLTPLQAAMCGATSAAELEAHRKAMEAGKPADPRLLTR